MAIPCTPQLVALFSVGTSGHPCQLLHRIVCHSQLGPLVRECLPWESGSLDILSQYVMWSLALWWQGAQMWCIQCDIIGAIISPCLMTMTGVGHFHMPLWAGLVWMMLCDTINFTYLLSSLCEFVSKLPLEVGWKVLRTTFLSLWPLWLRFIAEQKIRGGYLRGLKKTHLFLQAGSFDWGYSGQPSLTQGAVNQQSLYSSSPWLQCLRDRWNFPQCILPLSVGHKTS